MAANGLYQTNPPQYANVYLMLIDLRNLRESCGQGLLEIGSFTIALWLASWAGSWGWALLELAALAQLEANHRPVVAGTELVREREAGQHAYILQDGWACSYKLLPDGGRQVIDFPIPGDVIGLRSLLLRTADHNSPRSPTSTVAEVRPGS